MQFPIDKLVEEPLGRKNEPGQSSAADPDEWPRVVILGARTRVHLSEKQRDMAAKLARSIWLEKYLGAAGWKNMSEHFAGKTFVLIGFPGIRQNKVEDTPRHMTPH